MSLHHPVTHDPILKRAGQLLGLACRSGAVASLNDFNDVAGMLRGDNGGCAVVNKLNQLHNILENMLLHDVKVCALNMWQQNLVALRVGISHIAAWVLHRLAIMIQPDNGAFGTKIAASKTACDRASGGAIG